MPERILAHDRSPAAPTAPIRGRILMRVDPAAIGRFTRYDLGRQGYQVASERALTPDLVAAHAPESILYFHHTDEAPPLEALQALPPGVPVIIATVGTREPDRRLVELARRRGYPMLNSRLGPNLHIVLRTLSGLQTPQD